MGTANIVIKKHPSLAGKLLALVGPTRLSGNAFAAYGKGGQFDPNHKGRVVLPARLKAYVLLLQDAGLTCALDEVAQAALSEAETLPVLAISTDAEPKLSRAAAALARHGRALFGFQTEGVRWLASKQTALLADEMGTGKEQPVSEPVLTPVGWKPIGELRVGGSVIGSNGKSTEVIGVFPQGVKDVYAVTFNDGFTVRCGIDHLWTVNTALRRSTGAAWRVLSLRDIIAQGLRNNQGNLKHFVPVVSGPVEFEEQTTPLMLPAYLLGALIANGCMTGTSTEHSGTRDQIRQYLKGLGLKLTYSKPWTYRFVRRNGRGPNAITRLTHKLNLRCLSWQKQIPAEYMTSSSADRLALLQGLMDNDGTVCKKSGCTQYNTTSKVLSAQVVELVQSLGGVARVNTRVPTYTYLGRKLKGRVDYRINVSLPAGLPVFRVESKAAKFKPKTKYTPARAISSIEKVGTEESVCIRVSAADSLYLTKHYVVTHNTMQSLCAADDRLVIVCPAAARGSWEREIGLARPDLKVTQLEGFGSFRWPSDHEAVVLTYDVLPPTQEEKDEVTARLASLDERVRRTVTREIMQRVMEPALAGQAPEGVTVIADEAHALKGAVSKTTRVARFRKMAYSAKGHRGRIFLLTATPMLNRPMELWNVLACGGMAYEAFGKFEEFTHNAGGSKGRFGYEWDPRNMNKGLIAKQLGTVALRRLKSDVLSQLPAKTHTWMPISVRALLAGHELEALMAAEELEVLAETGLPDFEKTSQARALLAKAKIPAMLEVIESFEEQNTPLVVFSAHRAPIDTLKARKGWAVITGDTSAEERTATVASFQAGQLKGVALTIAAGGVAITLTHASNALFVDSSWTPAIDAQAEDRIHRIGQESACQYIHMMADSKLDEHVKKLHGKKSEFLQAVDMASTLAGAVVVPQQAAAPEAVVAPREPSNVISLADHAAATQKATKERMDAYNAEKEAARIQRAKDRRAAHKASVQDQFAREASITRPAASEAEERAIAGLQQLAEDDDDHASVKNGAGFSKRTTKDGHRLVFRFEVCGMLTDHDWKEALTIAHFHRKQLA